MAGTPGAMGLSRLAKAGRWGHSPRQMGGNKDGEQNRGSGIHGDAGGGLQCDSVFIV